MSRFYKTARVNNFIDFAHTLDKDNLKEAVISQSKFTEDTIKQANELDDTLLNINPAEIFKEDFQKVSKPILSEIDSITESIQKDPSNYSTHLPQLNKLKRELTRNINTGQLGAIKEGTARYNEQNATLKENFKNLPKEYNYLKDNYVEKIKKGLTYDAGLNTYGDFAAAEFAKPVTQKEEEDLVKNFVGNVNTKQFAKNLTDAAGNPVKFTVDHLNNIDKLLTTGQLKGVSKEELTKAFREYVPDEFLNYYQQRSQAANIDINELDRNGQTNQIARLASRVGLAGGLEKAESNKIFVDHDASSTKDQTFKAQESELAREAQADREAARIAAQAAEGAKNRANRRAIADMNIRASKARAATKAGETAPSSNNHRWHEMMHDPSLSDKSEEEVNGMADQANADTWLYHEKLLDKETNRVANLTGDHEIAKSKQYFEPFTILNTDGSKSKQKIFFDLDKGMVEIHNFSDNGTPKKTQFKKDDPKVVSILRGLRISGRMDDRAKVDYNKIKEVKESDNVIYEQ